MIKKFAFQSILYLSFVFFYNTVYSQFICGCDFTVTHNAGNIAPVTKTVSYGSVLTNLTGSNKCWITQNLGADHQAISATDATEASAGWYWQFNRKQGYKHDGTNHIPNTPWINSINENSNWTTANDPCALLLGLDWRIPTYTEWNNADAGWNSYNNTFASILKIHAGGGIDIVSNGPLSLRGSAGDNWSNTQSANNAAYTLDFDNTSSYVAPAFKAYGLNLRCVNDNAIITANAGTDTLIFGSTSVTLTGNIPTAGTGHWSILSGPGGFFGNDTVYNSIFTGTAGTTYVLVWTIFSPPCTFSDTVNVTFSNSNWSCGCNLTITHSAGSIAPITKTVSYGTVLTNLSGSNKCWITQNLGADHQALSATDATEASAGWYWQFNRKQGFKHDGISRTPNTAWISPINENSNWIPANDPCTILLGSGWRIPTNTEWINADLSWNNFNNTYTSVLKLHAAGGLDPVGTGPLQLRGSAGDNWSSVQSAGNAAYTLDFNNSSSYVAPAFKSYGLNLRCINDSFITTISSSIHLGNDTSICQGNHLTLNANNPGCTYLWNTGQNSQTINTTLSGIYSVKVTNASGCYAFDTINVVVSQNPSINLGNDTTFCQGNHLTLNANNPGSTYLWSTGQNSQTINTTLSGIYSVKVTNASGCYAFDTINIVVSQNPSINLGNDTTICQGNHLTLNANNPGSTYLWSTGQNSQTINTTLSGIYSVKVTNAIGCYALDTINVVFSQNPTVNLGNDTTFCQGNHLTLNANNPGCTYLWSTGQNSQTINTTLSGIYSVKVTNASGCYAFDTINIVVSQNPIVNLGNDTSLCQGNHLTLNANNPGCTYLWSTGQNSQTINISTAGSFSVKVTNNNGCYMSDTIIVNIISNLAIDLGNDTSICEGEFLSLNAGNAAGNFLWNTAETTQTIQIQNPGTYWVKVNIGNCSGSDSILIYTLPRPVFSLGNDTIICPGDLITLSPGSGFVQYHWSDGSGLNFLNVNNPGIYTVIVSNGLCSASDTLIIIECNSEIWIPNVFTPNGDACNETFSPVYSNIDKITLYIYNRWGNQLYEGSGSSAVWDGKYHGQFCSEGVYYYLLEYELKGEFRGKRQLHGSVTLLK